MADLITSTDIIDRLGRTLTTTEENRVAALIADASALARFESKCQFESETDAVEVVRSVAGKLRLPGHPTAITSVVMILTPPVADYTLPDTTWVFDGIDTIQIVVDTWDWIVNLPTLDWEEQPGTFRVTYDRGWTTIPPEIVGQVCKMVIRTLTAPSMAEGLVSENIGQYGYTLQQAAGSMGGGIRLLDEDRRIFRDPRWRIMARTIETGV